MPSPRTFRSPGQTDDAREAYDLLDAQSAAIASPLSAPQALPPLFALPPLLATTSAGDASATSTKTTEPTAALVGGATAPAWIATLSDSRLRADMTAACSTGVVTVAGMTRLFTNLAASLTSAGATLSTAQFNDLKTIVTNLNVGTTTSPYLVYITNALVNGNAYNARWTGGTSTSSTLGNLAAGSTAAQLNQLTGKWFLGTDLPSNSVQMSGSSAFTVSYSTVTKPLFASTGPSMTDINQGYLGDCYLLASLAEVAKQNPSAITSMITDNGNGTYGVRFYVKGVATYVTVNASLPNSGGIFNHGADLWASLVEKAYAQAQGGIVPTINSSASYGNSWSSIGNGGWPDNALAAITGASSFIDFYGSATSSTWSKYTYNGSLQYQSGVSSLSTSTVLNYIIAYLAVGDDVVLCSYTNATDAAGRTTLVSSHAMSVYGYNAATGLLQIRNPWGTASGQSWNTTFEVSLSTLLAAGDVLSVDNLGKGATIASFQTYKTALDTVGSFAICDTAANVQASLAALNADAANITTVRTSDARMTLGIGTFLAYQTIERKVSGGFAISDSTANVAHNLAALQTFASTGLITSIGFTDSAPTFVVTSVQNTVDAAAIRLIAGAYTLKVVKATATCDLNGDGCSDVLFRNSAGVSVMWTMNAASVSGSSTTSVQPNANWQVKGVNDFNGDGADDILWVYNNSANAGDALNGSLYISLQNGAIAIGGGTVAQLSSAWSVQGVGDFDGDGMADILFRNSSTGQCYVDLMNGATIASGAATSAQVADSRWTVAAVADFNGDGDADILWRYYNSANASDALNGALYDWTMNGTTVAGKTLVSQQPGAKWSVAGTGDFNGDGNADILFRYNNAANAADALNGMCYVDFMNGATVTSGAATQWQVDNSWSIAAIGDYNGDGKSDILWQNAAGAQYVWTMNGASVVAGAATTMQSGVGWATQSSPLIG